MNKDLLEMLADTLYAFAQTGKNALVCFAHVTNQMGSIEGDFEKVRIMAHSALELIATTVKSCGLK